MPTISRCNNDSSDDVDSDKSSDTSESASSQKSLLVHSLSENGVHKVEPYSLKQEIAEVVQNISQHSMTTLHTNIDGRLKENRTYSIFNDLRSSMNEPLNFRKKPQETVLLTSTFFCHICLESCAESSGFTCSGCTSCHKYCKSCLDDYFTTQIKEGIVRLACPGMGECNAEFNRDEIMKIVKYETLLKLERFEILKNDPNYRECPLCNMGVHYESPEDNPIITCAQCNSTYCFYHSNAHPGSSCGDYARLTREEMKISQSVVERTTRNCPVCEASTEKSEGCNHMTCQACQTNWCWICGQALTDVSQHYSAGNIFGCPGAQFRVHSSVTEGYVAIIPRPVVNVLCLCTVRIYVVISNLFWTLLFVIVAMVVVPLSVATGLAGGVLACISLPLLCFQDVSVEQYIFKAPWLGFYFGLFLSFLLFATVDLAWVPLTILLSLPIWQSRRYCAGGIQSSLAEESQPLNFTVDLCNFFLECGMYWSLANNYCIKLKGMIENNGARVS